MQEAEGFWAVTSAVAAAVAAVASLIALIVSISQSRLHHRALSMTSVMAFESDCRSLWKACRDAGDDFEECLMDIIALFELHVLSVQETEPSARVREYVEDTIRDYLSRMAETEGYGALIQPATVEPQVCPNLKDFIIQNRLRLPDAVAVGTMFNIPSSSLR